MARRHRRSLAPVLAGLVAAFVPVVSVVAQASVAGNWTLEVDSPQGLTKAGLMLAVDGELLKGTISSDMGETAFTGTAKDGTITFTFDFAGPSGPMTITTTGTVSGDAITGEMDYGMGVVPFTGKRAAK